MKLLLTSFGVANTSCQASTKNVGSRRSRRPTPSLFGVAIQCSCRTGSGDPGLQISFHPCPARGDLNPLLSALAS